MLEVRGLRAVLFDVDGTLYRQPPLRRAMALRLLAAHALRPLQGLRTLRGLSAYRRAQEALREASGDLARLQLEHAANASGVSQERIALDVARWMEQEPLPLLARYLRPGTLDFIAACRKARFKLGVLSDYPAEANLEALGLKGLFDELAFAQSADVGVFKPSPRGLLRLLERLGVAPSQALYVGDRPEVDAAAAAAAGVACAIVGSQAPRHPKGFTTVAGFPELGRLLFNE